MVVIILSLLSNRGEAQIEVQKQKVWWCIGNTGSKNIWAKSVGLQMTVNAEQEEALQKKQKPGSENCPAGFEWEEMPTDRNLQADGIAAGPATYYRSSTATTRVASGAKDTRSAGEMIAQSKASTEFGVNNCADFHKKFGKKSLKPMWDAMILRAYLFLGYPTFHKGKSKKSVEERLAAIRLEVAKTRARIVAESSGCPFSVSHAGAMGLTQIMPSTVQGFCPNQNLSDPFVQIWCGMAEAQNKANRNGGDAINTDLAYVAGSGRLAGYQERAGTKDSKQVLAHVKSRLPKVAGYVEKNHALWQLYYQEDGWFRALLGLSEFAFLTK